MTAAAPKPHALFHSTDYGQIYLGDCLDVLHSELAAGTVDLIVTSPPYGLVRKKEYGNVDADEYVDWFRPFAEQFRRVLRPSGSFVLDIGGAWNAGLPTRNLYHFKLLVMLCEEYGFHLAQEYYWWNPSKLPTPAEWVTVRRIRAKDAIECVWWLAPTPWPKASNRRVLQPYSASMRDLLRTGYRAKRRPSGHEISTKFATDNGAAIPPNLIAVANTESNSYYLRYCRDRGLQPHPARFPAELPEFFVRMLTDEGDLVVDPFAGSCVAGEVCERLRRRWVCAEIAEEYLKGALGRFCRPLQPYVSNGHSESAKEDSYYRIPRPGVLWNGSDEPALPRDGGRKRQGRAPTVISEQGAQPPPAAPRGQQLRLLKERQEAIHQATDGTAESEPGSGNM